MHQPGSNGYCVHLPHQAAKPFFVPEEKNEGINFKCGACANVKTKTHINTFTYGMNSSNRPYDMALYNSLTYEDRIKFDHYDLKSIYAETRKNKTGGM